MNYSSLSDFLPGDAIKTKPKSLVTQEPIFGKAVIKRGKDTGLKTREIFQDIRYIQLEGAKGAHRGANGELWGA